MELMTGSTELGTGAMGGGLARTLNFTSFLVRQLPLDVSFCFNLINYSTIVLSHTPTDK